MNSQGILLNVIESITKFNFESQNKRLRLFASLDVDTRIKIIKYLTPSFHKLKSVHTDADNAVLTLSALILSIDKVIRELDDVSLKAIKLRGKNHSTKLKRQKVIGYWTIVRTLKLEQNLSFRQISQYFAKYHHLEISYSTIYQMWNELEKNTKQEN